MPRIPHVPLPFPSPESARRAAAACVVMAMQGTQTHTVHCHWDVMPKSRVRASLCVWVGRDGRVVDVIVAERVTTPQSKQESKQNTVTERHTITCALHTRLLLILILHYILRHSMPLCRSSLAKIRDFLLGLLSGQLNMFFFFAFTL